MVAKSSVVIGTKYNRLTVIEDAGKNRHHKTLIRCVCDCGEECTVILSRAKSGLTQSCGCYKDEVISQVSRVNYTGVVSGRLTMLEDVGTNGHERLWKCQCECGNFTVSPGAHVKFGHIQSCGCLHIDNTRKANTTHGMSNSSEYFTYHKMIDRCYNPKDHKYESYGARGITVCERWLECFENFFEDMGFRPEGFSLERCDVNGNYCPENCKWDTASEQAFNQRRKKLNTSGVTGVYFDDDSDKWIARISKNRKEYYLGRFDDFNDAVRVRKQAELDLYGYLKDNGNA